MGLLYVYVHCVCALELHVGYLLTFSSVLLFALTQVARLEKDPNKADFICLVCLFTHNLNVH